MDDTSNSNKGTAILGLRLIIIPVDNWELFKRDTPVERSSLLVELLLELLKTTFLNLV